MLIDFDILARMGSTRARIKQVFTAQPGTEDHETRKTWESKLESRIQEGATWGLENYQFYYAADLAMDTNIITKELVPLSLFAQGKITLKDAASALKQLSPTTLAKFATFDEKGEPASIDFPAFHKIVVGLVRSFVTRRTAALSMRYVKQTPLFKFESLSTGYVAQLKADALSQRVEMIVNSYNYRHDMIQSIRDMLMYGESLEFATCAWEQEKTLRKKKGAEAFTDKVNFAVESVIAKEGIPFKKVHPTRRFYDMAYPLSSINTDTGCSYLGHWNLVPYRTVSDNPAYYNRDTISYDTSFASTIVGYRNYFELYSDTAPVNFPSATKSIGVISANNRDEQAGVYSSTDDMGDTSIMLTEYFERVTPSECGLGDYPHPVWLRLVVAADRTVVFGEFMPYTPAVYYGYNANDAKVKNMSFAMDAIAFQDQASNILTSYLSAQKASLLKLVSLDIDQIAKPEHVKYIREQFRGDSYTTTPILIEHKGAQSAELGHDRRKIVEISEASALADPTRHFIALTNVISLAERLLGISANEQGQSEQREISATENANIANVTNVSLAFMGQGVDEATAAKKKILYQGLMSKADANVRLPVVGRYTDATVEAAGFTVVDADMGEGLIDAPRQVTILGDKTALEYDYSFSSRDGSERPSNAKGAETLTLVLQQIAQIPGVLDKMGERGLYDYLNALFRMSGAPAELKLQIPDGAPPAAPAPAMPIGAEAVPAEAQATLPAAPAQVSTNDLGGFLSPQ